MTEFTPLQRAHTLSAEATLLLRSTNINHHTLQSALEAYRQAAELFERAATDVGVADGANKTLQMLTVQHRKLAKDVERRMGVTQSSSEVSSLPTSSQTRSGHIASAPLVAQAGPSGSAGTKNNYFVVTGLY